MEALNQNFSRFRLSQMMGVRFRRETGARETLSRFNIPHISARESETCVASCILRGAPRLFFFLFLTYNNYVSLFIYFVTRSLTSSFFIFYFFLFFYFFMFTLLVAYISLSIDLSLSRCCTHSHAKFPLLSAERTRFSIRSLSSSTTRAQNYTTVNNECMFGRKEPHSNNLYSASH